MPSRWDAFCELVMGKTNGSINLWRFGCQRGISVRDGVCVLRMSLCNTGIEQMYSADKLIPGENCLYTFEGRRGDQSERRVKAFVAKHYPTYLYTVCFKKYMWVGKVNVVGYDERRITDTDNVVRLAYCLILSEA